MAVLGMERLGEHLPSLIMLDLMMPEMDGFEFVHKLRQSDRWRTIPIVVLTSKELTQQDRHRLEGHVENILKKGATAREQLLKQVRKCITAQNTGV